MRVSNNQHTIYKYIANVSLTLEISPARLYLVSIATDESKYHV